MHNIIVDTGLFYFKEEINMISLLARQKYVPESEISGFRSLSESQQADVLYSDAIMLAHEYLDESVLSEKDAEEYHEAVNAINTDRRDADYQKAISILKHYPNIMDYQIVNALALNKNQIVKFLLRPYYNTNSDVKLLEAPKQNNDARNVKPKETSKPNAKENEDKSKTKKSEKAETKEAIQLPDTKQSEEKKEPKKMQQQKTNTPSNGKAAKNMTGMDIANAFSPDAKKSANNNNQHGPNCNCGHCHGNNNQQRQQVQQQAPMSLEEKTKLLKEHIDFSPVKGIKVKDWEVDNLLQFVNSPILKSKLKEYNSACNPEFPKLTICSKKYKFDKNLYKFAFYTPTNKSGKVLVVLYNTNATLIQGVGMTNEMGFIVVNESLVK